MELLLIYLWLKLDALQVTLGITAVICGITTLFLIIWRLEVGDAPKHAKKVVALFVASLLTSIVMPSSKEMAILVGSHYALRLADSTEGQKVMSLIRKKANDYLDEQLKPVEKK